MATVVQVHRPTAQNTYHDASTRHARTFQSNENGRRPKTGMRQPASTAMLTHHVPNIPPQTGAAQGLRGGLKTRTVRAKQPVKLDKELPAIPRDSTVTIPLAISKSVANFSPYLHHKHTSSLDSRPDESFVAIPSTGAVSPTKNLSSQQLLQHAPQSAESFELLKPTVFGSRDSPGPAQSPSTEPDASPIQASGLDDSLPYLSWTPLDDFIITPTSAAPPSPSRIDTAIKHLENVSSPRNFSIPPSINTPDLSRTPRTDDYEPTEGFPSPLALATSTQPLSPSSCPPPYFESEHTMVLKQYSFLPDLGSKSSQLQITGDIPSALLIPQKLSIQKKENRLTPKDIIADWRSSTSSDPDRHFYDDLPKATIDPAQDYRDVLAGLPPYTFNRPQSFISFKSSRPMIVIPKTSTISTTTPINLEKPLPIPTAADSPTDQIHLNSTIYHSHSDSNGSATATILPSYTDPTPPISPIDQETVRPSQFGKFPFEQPSDSFKSSKAILPAPPLKSSHFSCYTSHRNMVPSRNVLHPVACMTCGREDAESRWKCSWCCLRACKECMPKLDVAGRGMVSRNRECVLQSMLDSLAKT